MMMMMMMMMVWGSKVERGECVSGTACGVGGSCTRNRFDDARFLLWDIWGFGVMRLRRGVQPAMGGLL